MNGSTKRPASQYFWGDWRRDTALQGCSLAARGLWHEMNCLMHDCLPYGHLTASGKPMPMPKLARLVGISARECQELIAELQDAGVPSRTDDGTIYSRRMVRDEQLRERRAAGGQAGAAHGSKGAEHGVKGGRPRRSEGGSETPLDGSSKPPPAFASASADEFQERAADPKPLRAPDDGPGTAPPAPPPAAAAEPADAEEPGGPCDPPGDPPAPPDPAAGFIPTPAGRVCRAMREAGLASVNPSDPRLLALLEAGGDIAAQEAEFRGIAAEAVSKGSGWAWLLAVVERRRGEAGAIRARGGNGAASQPAEAPPPWLGSDRAVRAMAEQLGVVLRQGEDFDGWLRRIRAGWERAGRPALGGGAAPEAAAA